MTGYKALTDDFDRLVYAIGNVVALWANLEAVLGNCIADLVEVERHKAVILLKGASARRRVQLLQSALDDVWDLRADHEEFGKLLQRINKLKDERDMAAHRFLSADDETKAIQRIHVMDAHDGFNLKGADINPDHLIAVAEELRVMMNTIKAIWLRRFPKNESPMRVMLSPVPETSGPKSPPYKVPSQSPGPKM